jgi:hypothetical protein
MISTTDRLGNIVNEIDMLIKIVEINVAADNYDKAKISGG